MIYEVLEHRRMRQLNFSCALTEAGERTCAHFSREPLVVLLVAAAIHLS
jgi:hypothetical protein